MAFRDFLFLLSFLFLFPLEGPKETRHATLSSSLQRVDALSLATAGAPEASLWVSTGPWNIFSCDSSSTSPSSSSSNSIFGGGLRVGANVLHKWTGGLQTRLQLSADALTGAAAAGETGVERETAAAAGGVKCGTLKTAAAAASSPKKRNGFFTGGSSSSSFLSTVCEAVEVSAEALAPHSGRRFRTVVRLDVPTGRSRLLCAAADGNHEVVGQFAPALGALPAAASLSSSHLFKSSRRFLKLQPTHDFSNKVSQLRLQAGVVPQQQQQKGGSEENQQWTEVDFHVERQHEKNLWDGTIGLRQVFDGGRVSFAPYMRFKDRSLRYEYQHMLSNGGSFTAVLQPAQWLRLLWRDPSTSGGYWIAHAEIPLHKNSRGIKEGSLSFRREWAI